VFAGILVGLFLWRTVMEDRALRRELDGYEEYAVRTRYRLAPGVW
jgi:protein-S-isoprenylcysteine O-methyltransferase Ste14